ncbi:MAG: alpha-galactosidase [Clostridia bacterium]|nr:alpha-galactosidase [Clostridia bacterium]
MKKYDKLKIVMVGAGSCSFCPVTLGDILLSDPINSLPLTVSLMDIDGHALEVSRAFAERAIALSGRKVTLEATTDLDTALTGADFVVAAIEVDRYHYWSMDFHIPRRYGFRQVYGENGGPGGMFHTLRNLGPTLHIARRMEVLCPDAWLINYTNPEAKLVEAVLKLTKIRAVGVCHGFDMGVEQIARILEREPEELAVTAYGLNHFGWVTAIRDRATGEDLYPAFKAKEAESHWLASWDEVALSRMMLRTFGLYPYPGTNHIGEYIAWSDSFLASTQIQYFFDPVREKPWETRKPPRFVYDFCSNPTAIPFSDRDRDKDEEYRERFAIGEEGLTRSSEYGIPIIEAIAFDRRTEIPSLNLLNKGQIPGLLPDLCVEGPCVLDGEGIRPVPVAPLPAAISAMINRQGVIHQLILEAYLEKSRGKRLQAMLLDPTVSNYENAVALIDEMCERQKEILPELAW